jgi:amino acid efflux transporter
MGELAKAIGPWRGTAMMLNIVLGAGLLTLPGLAVQTAGGSALVVWAVCALAAVPLLVVFALLGREHPDAGGLASILKSAFGAYGYIPSTFLFLGAVAVGLPAIALTGGYYAAAAVGGPPHLYAALLIVLAMLGNLASAEIASRINTLIASAVLVVLVGITVTGWLAVDPTWETLSAATHAPIDLSTFGLAFMMVFFAFTGWEVAANLSGEFRDARRNIPIAMALSFVLAVGLYLALAVVVVASGPVGANEAPFAHIFGAEFGPVGSAVISGVSVVMIYANLSAALWAVSRMVYSAANERLLFAPFTRLVNGVPLNAVFLTTGVLLGVVFLSFENILDIGSLLAIAGQNFLLLYAGAAAALVRLSSNKWSRALGWGSLALVAVLLAGRGLDGLLYPLLLITGGLLIALVRSRLSILLAQRREGST